MVSFSLAIRFDVDVETVMLTHSVELNPQLETPCGPPSTRRQLWATDEFCGFMLEVAVCASDYRREWWHNCKDFMHAHLNGALRALFATAVLLAAFWVASPVAAQSAAPATERQASTPYAGDLSIFETPGRDERLQVNRVMDLLSIEPGRNVVDIGAGSGWFTVLAARRITNSGTVYAVDINPEAIRHIEQRAKKEQLQNIKAILSEPDDPQLPADSVDAVLLLKTYHEIAHPIALLSNLRSSLKPGAKIGIIDRNGTAEDHGVNKDVVIRQAAEAGYELHDFQDFVKGDGMDYLLIFTAKAR